MFLLRKFFASTFLFLCLFSLQPAQADTISDIEKLFDWAEKEYPDLFPQHSVTDTLDEWRFRYYPQTNNYMGVNDKNEAWVLGDAFGSMTFIAPMADLLAMIPTNLITPTSFTQAIFYDDIAKGICFEFNTAAASVDFVAYYVALGGQPGNCPAANYYAQCNYLTGENVQGLLLFKTFPVSDSFPTCGANGGIYTDSSGSIDTSEQSSGTVNSAFTTPIFRNTQDVGGNIVYCREMEANGMNPVMLDQMLTNVGFAYGACPAQNFIGFCSYTNLGGTGLLATDYWKDSARDLDVTCAQTGGTWVGL